MSHIENIVSETSPVAACRVKQLLPSDGPSIVNMIVCLLFAMEMYYHVQGCMRDLDGFWIGLLDLFHCIHSHNMGLQAIQRYR
jgi:hypothetical protein